MPGNAFIKNMGESVAGIEKAQTYEVVLARIEEAWQLAFLIERIEGSHGALFVPGALNPLSGTVFFMTEDRIKRLDIPLSTALKCLRRLGRGRANCCAVSSERAGCRRPPSHR